MLRNIGVEPRRIPSDRAPFRRWRGASAKLKADTERMGADLDGSREVLAEPIQTVMRRTAWPGPYEQLKALTRRSTGISAKRCTRLSTASHCRTKRNSG